MTLRHQSIHAFFFFTSPNKQVSTVCTAVWNCPTAMPHSPHTISSRTMSSVATNTSRVSPTLCHILGGGGRAAAAGRAARPGLQRRAPGAAGPRAGMGGGRPSAAPPGGGAGRRGGGRGCRPDRPSLSPRPAGRGLARVSLRPHRSGEPRTRRPETPAAAGCAPMADAASSWIGETASTGPRGGHPALVATRPRVPQPPRTAEVNVSRLRRGCLSAPSPLPLRQLITERPHHSPPPRRGAAGRWSAEAGGDLRKPPCRDYNSQNAMTIQSLCFSLPRSPSAFDFPQPTTSVYRLRVDVLGTRAVVYFSGLYRSARVISTLLHTERRFV